MRYRVMPVPRKGRDRFSAPHRITGLVGPSAYRLDGGTLVHAERLTRWTGAHPGGPGGAQRRIPPDLPVVCSQPGPPADPVAARTPEEPARQADVADSPRPAAAPAVDTAAATPAPAGEGSRVETESGVSDGYRTRSGRCSRQTDFFAHSCAFDCRGGECSVG